MLIVSSHAIDRAIERLPGIRTEGQAIAALDTPATRLAAQLGAKYVRVGTGQRIVIDRGNVVTVLPRHARIHEMGSQDDARRDRARAIARHCRRYSEQGEV